MTEAVMLLLDREFNADLLRTAPALDLRNIGAKVWKRLLVECGARDLSLYHLTVTSIDGIQQLQSVRALKLQWATKITDLEPLFRMTWLDKLSIVDVAKVRSISGVEHLSNLTELELSGNPGSLHPPMRLETLRPLIELPRLKRLSLRVMRLEDDDISCLASMKSLRSLQLSNQFETAQYAYLARHLNSQLENPIVAHVRLNRPCQTCGGDLHMFTGRRQPTLCRSCDSARFDKLTEAFNALVARSL